ncbi:MAG: kelch repeat-containing protein [Candidatus Bathyarchaeota archaeon]|jgi:N-acetylneuraminic acid mutarotase
MGAQRTALILLLILCLVISSFPAVSADVDFWTTLEPVPTAESGLGACVVDGKIYVMGTKVNYVYDPTTNTWATREEPMPTSRGATAVAVYQNKIFVIGGYLADGSSSNANEVYDPATGTWENMEQMPTNRAQLEANVVNGKIYLIAGRRGGPQSTVTLNEVYDIETDTWTTKEPIPYPVVQYASAVVDNKIYVMGGQNEYHKQGTPINVDLNQIYDTETDTWSFGASLPVTVWNAAAGATTGIMAPKRIYVIGGTPYSALDATKINQVYDPEHDRWSSGASMPTARAWLSVVVVDDLLYVMGGSPGLMLQSLNTNENYTPVGYIPEFPSWLILPLFLTITLAGIVVKKKAVLSTMK